MLSLVSQVVYCLSALPSFILLENSFLAEGTGQPTYPFAGAVQGVQVLGCLANADPMAGAGARLAMPGFYTGTDFTACIRFQFQRLARTTVVMRVDNGSIRPLLQLGENRCLYPLLNMICRCFRTIIGSIS